MRCKEPEAMPRPRSEGFRYIKMFTKNAICTQPQSIIGILVLVGILPEARIKSELSSCRWQDIFLASNHLLRAMRAYPPKMVFSLSPHIGRDLVWEMGMAWVYGSLAPHEIWIRTRHQCVWNCFDISASGLQTQATCLQHPATHCWRGKH